MMRHLVIGASGQVGGYLFRTLKNAGEDVEGTYHSFHISGLQRLDIRQEVRVQELIAATSPDIVYLPAAQSNVEYCEVSADDAHRTNIHGLRHVVRAVNDIGATIVFFSSDYIFDGKAGPYREDDAPHPINVYGWQKLAGEHYIALHAADYLVVRTTVVYGWERQGKNFVCHLLRRLRSGSMIHVPTDQVGNPTYAPNLADAVAELAIEGIQGVYHIAGPDRVSRYEFACEAARAFGLDSTLIWPTLTVNTRQRALRPLEAGMVVDKAVARLTTPLVGYQEGLKIMAFQSTIEDQYAKG